jgi:hypothetical protein
VAGKLAACNSTELLRLGVAPAQENHNPKNRHGGAAIIRMEESRRYSFPGLLIGGLHFFQHRKKIAHQSRDYGSDGDHEERRHYAEKIGNNSFTASLATRSSAR